MKTLYKCSIVLILLSMTACSPAATAITQPASDPQSAATEVPPPTPAPTFTPEVYAVDQKVEAYMNGETVSVVELSAEQQEAFANKLAEKLNETKGAKPVIYNHEAYVDPATGNADRLRWPPRLGGNYSNILPRNLR